MLYTLLSVFGIIKDGTIQVIPVVLWVLHLSGLMCFMKALKG